ncbi:beta strand repeat-containing protein [Streptomyces sp. NPDC002577]
MARRHSTGWEVLGFTSDPTPGDPEAIRTLASTYQELGDGAGEAFDLLRGDGAIRQGKGKTMDALKEKINKDLPGLLEKTRDSFHKASEAYNKYADTLTNAQDMLDRAIDEGQEVAATAKTDVPALAPDATPDQVDAHTTQQNAVNAAKDRLSAAEALGRDAQRLREDGSRTASVILDEAAGEAIPERGFFKKVGDFLADNPLIEIIAGIVVGIIAVFLPVVGVLLGALLLGASIIRMVSQGKIDVGDLIIGVLTLVPGGVLLGALGKVGGSIAKFAKLAPLLSKLGKGAGTISGALAKIIKSSTFVRKIINPLGKGLVGLSVKPGVALAGKVLVDVGTEFSLGFLATGITALADGKKFDLGPAALGSLIGALSGGVLSAFGGTKFANSIKDAFTTKGKFKSNIDKAFSKASLGIVDGKFKPSSILHVDGKGQAQKNGFHGINSSTSSDPSDGVLKTKVTTPDGTKTEAKVTPPANNPDKAPPADDLPFSPPENPVTSTKTTTPDGFTSETKDGTNTIKSPAGDKVTSNGNTTKIETPLGGKGAGEKTVDVLGGDFAGDIKDGFGAFKEKLGFGGNKPTPTLNTELTPGGGFKTSGSFGDVNHQPGGGTTFSTPNADGSGNTPQFNVNGNDISTPGGLTVTDGPDFKTVSGGGISVNNQNDTTSVFNTPNPGNNVPPVVTHDPGNGNIDVNLGNNTTITGDANNIGNGVTLPSGTHTSVDNAGNIHVSNGGAGGQNVDVAPINAGGNVTITDGNTTTHIPTTGGATINTPGGPTTTLDHNGFTVNTGGANSDTIQFNGNNGTLDVTPPGGHPPVTVSPNGDVNVGGITTNHTGGGSVTDGTHSVDFSPGDIKFNKPDGSSFNVNPNGTFAVDGIHKTPDGTINSGATTVNPDGSATISHGGQDFNVNPNGQITVTPTGGKPGIEGAPQPTPGNPVNLGNSTISVDGAGHHTITVTGNNGSTVTVSPHNGTTTVNSGPFQVHHGPNGINGGTTGANPIQVSHGTDGITKVSNGGTTVSTGPNAPTTVGNPGGGQPAVTVHPSNGDTPTQVDTGGNSTTTLTDNGAQTDVGNKNVANGNVDNNGSITTNAPAGDNTTVTNTPQGTTATDTGGNFSVDNNGNVNDGGITVKPNTDDHNRPVADITNNADGGGKATLTNDKIDSGGITTKVDTNGDVTFTHQPAGGGPGTTATSSPNGAITTQGPDGTNVELDGHSTQLPGGGIAPNNNPETKITSPNGDVITSNGQTITHSNDGFTTTIDNGPNGQTTTTVHNDSGVGHTIDPNGQATVNNSPSGADISGTNTQVTVNTPQQEGPGLFGSPNQTGGQNTLSNGPDGPTITTHGADPIHEPGSTVTHNTDPGHEGEFTTTYGPAEGTFGPGGVTELGPSNKHFDPDTLNPIDTGRNPIGNGPGETSISTVHGDGNSGINVNTPGNGPTLHHDGFFGGTTSVDTGNVSIIKTPGTQENAGTAGQKSGVVDGPLNPLDPAPAPTPESFNVGGNNGGPNVEVPVGGKGGSTVHGPFDVKSTGNGTFEVSPPGGGNGPNDKVTINNDGTLNGPGVTTPPALPPGQQGPVQPPHATLSNGTTVYGPGGGAAPTVNPPGGVGPTTTFNNGTATTTDVGSGVTITQHPNGSATFNSNTGGEHTVVNVNNGGVDGTVVKNDGNGLSTFDVNVGDSGAVKVKDGSGNTVSELDPAGGFNEQHSPVHEYYSHTSGPTAVTDLHEYGYEALTSVLKGVFNQGISAAYQIGVNGADPLTTLENAGIRLGNGIGNSLGSKKIENDYVFKTKGPEVPLATIPTKTIGNLNNNADIDLAHPKEEQPIKVELPTQA